MAGCYGQSGSGHTSESHHHKDYITYSHGLNKMNSNRSISFNAAHYSEPIEFNFQNKGRKTTSSLNNTVNKLILHRAEL